MASGQACSPLASSSMRVRRAMLVADLVESVRLMAEDESSTIERWRTCVKHVHELILPVHGGRLVKSYGDGFLLEFGSAQRAAAAALAIQDWSQVANHGTEASKRLALRIGVHMGDVVADELDLYGIGVNLTARIASIAAPDQIVISSLVRDQLVDGLDGRLIDLGPKYFKHVRDAVHCFELAPQNPGSPAQALVPLLRSPLPVLAVIPFAGAGEASGLGTILCDRLVVGMSQLGQWWVVSRLTSLSVDNRGLAACDAGALLDADFILGGQCEVDRGLLKVVATLSPRLGGEPILEEVLQVRLDDLCSPESETVNRLATVVARALLDAGLRGVQGLPPQSIAGYALLLGSVQQMHRLSADDRDRALVGLQHLIERFPRCADIHAWLGKWHFLRIAQVDGADVPTEAAAAREHLSHALDLDPSNGLAAALVSHMRAFVDGDLQTAEAGLRQAVATSPNEALGWLFLGQALALRGSGAEATAAIDMADRLSPLDPMRYFVEMFRATALLCEGRDASAAIHAQRSVDLNALHLPGLAVLIIAQQLSGQTVLAQSNARRYLALRPTASVARYRRNHPVPDGSLAQRSADALRAAGIPE